MSGNGEQESRMGSSSTNAPYSHIESLLRALHQPNLNVSRPELPSKSSLPAPSLGNIEEQPEESPVLERSKQSLPVLFDIESVSENSSSPPSRSPSSSNIENFSATGKEETEMDAGGSSTVSGTNRVERNLERFNKNVLNIMDMMKSRSDSPMPLTPSASTGKPFAFYHRMHRHNSAHSLNIPNIVVTGIDPQNQPHNHQHKKFSFGLRRHSHAVVGYSEVSLLGFKEWISINRSCGVPSFRLTENESFFCYFRRFFVGEN